MFAGALACHVKSLNEHGIDLTANEDPPMRSPTHFFCPITHTFRALAAGNRSIRDVRQQPGRVPAHQLHAPGTCLTRGSLPTRQKMMQTTF